MVGCRVHCPHNVFLESRIEGCFFVEVDMNYWYLQVFSRVGDGLCKNKGTQFMAASLPHKLCWGSHCFPLCLVESVDIEVHG